MAKVYSIYFTASGMGEAERIARGLLAERLVACVNILPGAVSLYRWQGAVQRDSEVVCFAKTRKSRAEEVLERIRALHSYSVPALFALPVKASTPAALEWLGEQVPKRPRRQVVQKPRRARKGAR